MDLNEKKKIAEDLQVILAAAGAPDHCPLPQLTVETQLERDYGKLPSSQKWGVRQARRREPRSRPGRSRRYFYNKISLLGYDVALHDRLDDGMVLGEHPELAGCVLQMEQHGFL